MKKLLIAAGVIALILVGVLFVGGVSPVIVVAPEHIATVGGISITNTMITGWVVVALLCLVAVIAGRGVKEVPSGFSGLVEAMVLGFYGIVTQVAGEKNGRRFFPLVGTIFFTVVCYNYFGLLPISSIGKPEPGHGGTQVVFQQSGGLAYIPLKPEQRKVKAGDPILLPEGFELEHEGAAPAGKEAPATAPATGGHTADLRVPSAPYVMDLAGSADAGSLGAAAQEATDEVERSHDGSFSGALAPYFRSVNTDINAPLAIALFSFVFVEMWGLQSLGPGYLKKFFAFGAIMKKGPMGVIDVAVGALEFVSELSRIVSFTFRLFGNVFAGEVLLLMMSFLVPFLLVDVFYGLELFVGLIQGFVFAMLTLVFAVTAVSHHGDGEHEEHGAAADQMAPAHH
ncbi:MAG: F0F1 ATP synthase subunit A [Dehalococcoidia bacterium]|nr:MAG: F0F1 ATP synthase subunit A [Dehalococcoidia bacterium]